MAGIEAGSTTKELEAKCLCGSVHFNLIVPTNLLPLQAYLCHCHICRTSTGAPCIFHARLPKGVNASFIAPSSEDNMTKYDPQDSNDGSGLFSCTTCGCHITAIGPDGNWTISNSIFATHKPEDWMIRSHVYSKSAKNGGINQMLTHSGDRQLEDYNPPEGRPDAKIVEYEAETGEDGKDRLRAQCYCGGVSFTIQRPTQAVLDDEALSKYVSPLDRTKWNATWDVCDDCRLVNGTHVVGWTFIPLSLCEPKIGPDLKIGTMKTYSSSPGVLRSFCGTCAATFFYTTKDRESPSGDQIVDLATGTLRPPEGAMAENWLTWRSRVAWHDSGKRYDNLFADELASKMKEWVVGKYGREVTHEIG